jgi:hypothetical protein
LAPAIFFFQKKKRKINPLKQEKKKKKTKLEKTKQFLPHVVQRTVQNIREAKYL